MGRKIPAQSAPVDLPCSADPDTAAYPESHADRSLAATKAAKLGYIGGMRLFLAIFEAYTGYLLPLDQLAFWAVTTAHSISTSFHFTKILQKRFNLLAIMPPA